MLILLATLLGCAGSEDTGEGPQAPACPEGQILDGEQCVPEACGVGPFGDRQGEFYVDPKADGEQDGSREHPFADITDALEAADSGDRVVLSSGSYRGTIRTDQTSPVAIVGRCKELTVLDAEGETVGVYGHQTGTHLEQLTITGAVEAGVFSFAETVVLRDVDLVAAGYVGFWVAEGGTAELERVLVLDPVLDPVYDVAWGVVATEGSNINARELSIENAIDAGVYLEDAGLVDMQGLRITNTHSVVGSFGGAVVMVDGGELVLRDCTLIDNGPVVVLFEAGTTGLLDGCWIEGSSPQAEHPIGLYVARASVTIRNSVIVDVPGSGVEVFGSEALLVMEDVDVSNTAMALASETYGFGLAVRQGRLIASRVRVADSGGVGVWVSEAGVAELNEVVIDAVHVDLLTGISAGIHAREEGQVVLQGVEVRNLDGIGLSVFGGHIEGSAVVEEIRAAASLGTGHCVDVTEGSLDLQDSLLRDCQEIALGVGVNGSASLRNSTVEDIGSTDSYEFGLALLAQEGGSLTATDVDIGRTASSAVAATGEGSVVLDGVHIEGAWLNDSFDNGYALFATEGGSIEGFGLRVDTAGGLGVLVDGEGSQVLLEDADITGVYRSTGASTAFGALVQHEGLLGLTGVRFSSVEGPGLACSSGGTLEAVEIEVSDVRFAGLVLQGCTASLAGLWLGDVAEDKGAGGGMGVFIDGESHGPNTVEAEGLVAEGSRLGGVVVVGSGSVVLNDSQLEGSEGVLIGSSSVHGHALFARDCDGLALGEVELHDGRAGLFLHACTASFQNLDLHGNEVDVHQQGCDGGPTITPPTGASATLCPTFDELMLDLDFDAVVSEISLEP